VRPRAQDGAIHLHGNRYWAEFLHAQRGSQVVARFDPELLHEPLHIYAADGRYLGDAECLEAAGFNSVPAAQEQGRRWKQYLRATRQEAEALERMSIAEVARKLPQIEAAEQRIADEKAERDRINGLMEQLKGFNVGTPEYKKLEAEIAKGQGDFNVNAQLQKKDFMDREAKVYLQVYTEVEKAVAQFAREHGIAVVFRFDGDPVDGADRNQILRGITKPIVYYESGNDITPDILKMLNGAAVADQTGRPGAMPPRR
jgi:Skp family chaperone for outer membrane proteins